jgi:hypothetical protein
MRSVRVAYFVQTHRAPKQVYRLLAALRRGSPEAVLVVGHDATAPSLDERTLARLGAWAFRPHDRPRRGYWSLFAPYPAAVELLDREGVGYDWLVYLSGQDYPVRPLADSEAHLAASELDGYLTWIDAAEPSPEGRRRQGRLRYDYRYRDVGWPGPALRLVRALNGVQHRWHLHLTYGPRLGRRAPRTSSGPRLPVCWGSQWTTLRRSCAERVAEAARGELAERFAATVCPDEAFAQTVLVNDPRFRLANDNLRFVDVGGSRDGRPRVLRLADGPAISAGAYAFARKFDTEVDAAVLDWLDERLSP